MSATPKRVENEDLSGARFRDVDLTGAKFVGAIMSNADLSGMIDGLRINGIEVAPLISRELERRYPERTKIFQADPGGMREAWEILTDQLGATWRRAEGFSEQELNERVDEEWSTVETIRHLVFVVDSWIGRVVLGRGDPFDRIALPPTFLPSSAPGVSCDPEARPTFHQALAVWRTREEMVSEIVAALTPEELERRVVTSGAGYPPAGVATQVVGALWTVMDEVWWHNHFMNRDLDVLEKTR